MTRLLGRAPRGKRLYASAPQSHWHTTTMICSMRLDGSTACMAVDGATDTEVFRAYVQEVLCPTLRLGDVVIMDNLSPHKSSQTLPVNSTGWCPGPLPAVRRTSTQLRKCGANSKNFFAAKRPDPCPHSSRP